ncbi:hypothetical protein NE237_014793 [Protea cynaroides]|uniref:Uncharacterized protein n=1 Tax=Protea cynaroides TaxID=273540 RepID=A0A9Q0KCT8_9MAGN|nr:hypothetical protein NE237_014793 [Protea cynaroides]
MESEDLGRFLGFPTLETRSIKEGQSCDYLVIDVGGDKVWVQRRKRRKWLAKEKGKSLISDDLVVLQNSNVQQRGSAGDPVNKSRVGGRSYEQVIGGFPDLTSLPEPVVTGGVMRVVLPQEAVDRQLEKYQLALVGRVYTKGLMLKSRTDNKLQRQKILTKMEKEIEEAWTQTRTRRREKHSLAEEKSTHKVESEGRLKNIKNEDWSWWLKKGAASSDLQNPSSGPFDLAREVEVVMVARLGTTTAACEYAFSLVGDDNGSL